MTHRTNPTNDRFGGLVVVSNRLPLSMTVEEEGLQVHPSAGGLVAALAGTERNLWVGWPGMPIPEQLEERATELLEPDGYVPVYLSEEEQEGFYNQISNDTLWPLFHYFIDRLHFTDDAWARYAEVNERFAETVARCAPQRARVWIHDFHLALVPEALRSLRPDVAIGFFLHVPFPSSEIYRLLPTRSQILRGMLGADYIGFQIGDYARHFRSSCLRVLGIDPEPDAVEYDGRSVGIGVHPVGIDVERFQRTLAEPETRAIEDDLERRYRGRTLVLGVERLDYTKGVPEKLDAFERILEQEPERAATTVMLQVLVPSRLESSEFQAKRDEIELRISHVNGRFGDLGRTPIEYIHRPLSHSELAALYRRADVIMVTPLRDGMNLVAQEFVCCQAGWPEREGSWRGVLLLSEFAGAAQLLPGALLVNPWDPDDMASRLVEAIGLDATERRRRLELMSDRVLTLDCRRWSSGFLARLERYAAAPSSRTATRLDPETRESIEATLEQASARTLFLDYDGTLRELASHPDLAAPTPEITELLGGLARLPATEVHLISGRKHETLEAWFGELPIYLGAEHGYLSRAPGGEWTALVKADLGWLPRIQHLFDQLAADVPGTLVERKSASVAWHYRQAEPEYGAWRARELLVALDEILAGFPAEVIPGHRVVEVRARGVNKGAYLRQTLRGRDGPGSVVLAAGDDHTDMDLFRALPGGSIALHVGRQRPGARNALLEDQYTVGSPEALRGLLWALVGRIGGREPLAGEPPDADEAMALAGPG